MAPRFFAQTKLLLANMAQTDDLTPGERAELVSDLLLTLDACCEAAVTTNVKVDEYWGDHAPGWPLAGPDKLDLHAGRPDSSASEPSVVSKVEIEAQQLADLVKGFNLYRRALRLEAGGIEAALPGWRPSDVGVWELRNDSGRLRAEVRQVMPTATVWRLWPDGFKTRPPPGTVGQSVFLLEAMCAAEVHLNNYCPLDWLASESLLSLDLEGLLGPGPYAWEDAS